MNEINRFTPKGTIGTKERNNNTKTSSLIDRHGLTIGDVTAIVAVTFCSTSVCELCVYDLCMVEKPNLRRIKTDFMRLILKFLIFAIG